MQRSFLILFFLFTVHSLHAQAVRDELAATFRWFEEDAQMRNAISSICVMERRTGKVVFEKGSRIGLAPASTQKIITAATAYELLGKTFRYKTDIGFTGQLSGKTIQGDIYIQPSGDPTLGSWRWNSTREEAVLERIGTAFKNRGITGYRDVLIQSKGWEEETIPDGWIWQDIGNYYGAGSAGVNWRENQYDILLRSGEEIGSAVTIGGTIPAVLGFKVKSVAKGAAKGTGDNAFVYYPLLSDGALVRGTIPVGEKRFVISAAFPNSSVAFSHSLKNDLTANWGLQQVKYAGSPTGFTLIHMETSPPLDSIIYWFNRKSINLYGEALLKTFSYQNKGVASTDEGAKEVKALWKEKGIAEPELNIVDGSGLSPLNRVTTRAQADILYYASKQTWFPSFYHSLPEFNKMKMKSGTIRGVKGFTGYHTSKKGVEYIFSFLVNNYNGSSSAVVQKMYKVLDVLK